MHLSLHQLYFQHVSSFKIQIMSNFPEISYVTHPVEVYSMMHELLGNITQNVSAGRCTIKNRKRLFN